MEDTKDKNPPVTLSTFPLELILGRSEESILIIQLKERSNS